MAKFIKKVKLQIPAGKATPAPPVGTALGPTGVNMQEFCQAFNDKTKDMGDFIIPVVIYINEDKSYTFEVKQPPMSNLIKTELSLKSGSKEPHKDKVAHLSADQMKKIAEQKVQDMNATSLDAALRQVRGSARSMGITCDDN